MRSGCEQATVFVVAIAVVLAAASHGFAQDTERPRLRAGVLPERFAIDGLLDEPAWGMAELTEAFAQADPMQGAAPSARTLFLDGRSGYVFALNPSGARYDGLINPGGESDNVDWDGIWEAATARSTTGWSAELWIPMQVPILAGGKINGRAASTNVGGWSRERAPRRGSLTTTP
jgi:hypothetical protein